MRTRKEEQTLMQRLGLIPEEDFAALLGVAVKTLKNRPRSDLPEFVKAGRRRLYYKASVARLVAPPPDPHREEWIKKRKERPWNQFMDGWVYFVRSAPKTPVKIGFSGHTSLSARVAALQTGSPYKLRIVAQALGSVDDERVCHQIFAADRVAGEWFKDTPRIVAFMNRLETEPLIEVIADEMAGDSDEARRIRRLVGYSR